MLVTCWFWFSRVLASSGARGVAAVMGVASPGTVFTRPVRSKPGYPLELLTLHMVSELCEVLSTGRGG